MPDTRQSLTHKLRICGHEGYSTVGLFKDGRPGEVFIKIASATDYDQIGSAMGLTAEQRRSLATHLVPRQFLET